MGNIGNFLAIGLGFNSLTERGLPGADVVGKASENGWRWMPAGYAAKFPNSAAADLCRDVWTNNDGACR